MSKREIVSVDAHQVATKRGNFGIEAHVRTSGGIEAKALCTAGISVGSHEVKFCYDGGTKWGGKGVTKACKNIKDIIEPVLVGMDVADQTAVDLAMLSICENVKEKIGGNATAAVSAAVLKAGAAALGIPLYRHIGGVNAVTMPVPSVPGCCGSKRYGGGVTQPDRKPSYTFVCYDFNSYSEASYAAWELHQLWRDTMIKMGVGEHDQFIFFNIQKGFFKSDEELFDLMCNTIAKAGYEGRMGIQVDAAADAYYDREKKVYRGLFSPEERTRDQLMDFYLKMIRDYNLIILEDPFYEDDYESHALITKESGIQIVGDDLFTTTTSRLEQGYKAGAANCVLLKVNQIGTITEAFEMVNTAYRLGYGVMPCESRGELDTIADYAVGLSCGTIRECGIGDSNNRLLEIEAELGSAAKFWGRRGLNGDMFRK